MEVVLVVYGLAAQQGSAMSIGDGQRVAASAIAGAEPAFEIAAPEVVGLETIAEGHRIGRHVTPATAATCQADAGQNGAAGARRGPALTNLGGLVRQRLQLQRAPKRMRSLGAYDSFDDRLRHRRGMVSRHARPVH